MKIILTLEEATNIVVSSMNDKGLPIGFNDVTIDGLATSPGGMNYVESICRVKREFSGAYTVGGHADKIGAIKRLRALTGIGLAEAK